MQTLAQDIKTHNFRPVYLIYGEEAFLKNSYKNQLVAAVTGGDTMNYHHFQGKGIDVEELISLADTMPFLAEKRVLLIEDSGFFKGSCDGLAEWIGNIPHTACMIFVESEVDKRSRLFKQIGKIGYAAQMTRQDNGQLARWAGTILAREGRKITGRTMELFLSMTGDDMENIRMELEKLISYTMGREVITDEDVETICTQRLTNRIFELVTALVNGQTRTAMDLYEELLALKEPPMRILFLIVRQFNQLLQVKEMMAKGKDKSSVASALKVPPFAVGKMMAQAKSFSREQILDCVTRCVDMEEAVKTGRLNDRMAVELLLTGIRK